MGNELFWVAVSGGRNGAVLCGGGQCGAVRCEQHPALGGPRGTGASAKDRAHRRLLHRHQVEVHQVRVGVDSFARSFAHSPTHLTTRSLASSPTHRPQLVSLREPSAALRHFPDLEEKHGHGRAAEVTLSPPPRSEHVTSPRQRDPEPHAP